MESSPDLVNSKKRGKERGFHKPVGPRQVSGHKRVCVRTCGSKLVGASLCASCMRVLVCVCVICHTFPRAFLSSFM